MEAKMKKLLKLHELNSDMQYFEKIAQHAKWGDYKSAKVMFGDMSEQYRKAFVKAFTGHWNSGLSQSDQQMFIDLI